MTFNLSNRLVRTRMPGGVGGDRREYPAAPIPIVMSFKSVLGESRLNLRRRHSQANLLESNIYLEKPRKKLETRRMSKHATLSTNIDADLKDALALFCKKHGLKIQTVVENAIRERLEDEMDLLDYTQRKNEEEVTLAQVLKKLRK